MYKGQIYRDPDYNVQYEILATWQEFVWLRVIFLLVSNINQPDSPQSKHNSFVKRLVLINDV